MHESDYGAQISMEPDLWRGAERNRTGDRFTFEVKRAVIREVSFQGSANERFTLRLPCVR